MYTDILHKLDQVLAIQQKILGVVNTLKAQTPKQEEWLDNADMKQLLKISDATLYRLRKRKQLLSKKIGGKWYYAKSAMDTEITQRQKPFG